MACNFHIDDDENVYNEENSIVYIYYRDRISTVSCIWYVK